jgi:hypothetical protein
MAATTTISARVNPACKAQASPDLYLDFTVFSAFPDAMFELKTNDACEQLSPGPLHIAPSQISDVARSEFAPLEVTNVSGLLYQDILTQPLQSAVKITPKLQNIKQLYLFAGTAKIFKHLRFRTRAGRHIGAVTFWALSFWPVTQIK